MHLWALLSVLLFVFIVSSLFLGFEESESTIIFSSWIFWTLILQWWPKTNVSCCARAALYLCWYCHILKTPSLLLLYCCFLLCLQSGRNIEGLCHQSSCKYSGPFRFRDLQSKWFVGWESCWSFCSRATSVLYWTGIPNHLHSASDK